MISPRKPREFWIEPETVSTDGIVFDYKVAGTLHVTEKAFADEAIALNEELKTIFDTLETFEGSSDKIVCLITIGSAKEHAKDALKKIADFRKRWGME